MPKQETMYLQNYLIKMICFDLRAGQGWQYGMLGSGEHLFLHRSGLFFLVADEVKATPLEAERIVAAASVAIGFNQVGWHDVLVQKVELDVVATLVEHAVQT